MKLYGILGSPYVARVVLFGRLKGIDLVPTPPEGGIKSAEYLAENPIGKVPVLDVDGTCVPESAVICELLDELYAGPPGQEATPLERARARTVARIFDMYISPQSGVLFRNMNPATRDGPAVATAQDELARGIDYLRHYMTADPYAVGRHVTVADCTLLPAFAIFRKTLVPALGTPDPTKGSGKLASWWNSLAQHPVAGPFMPEYDLAVDDLLRMFGTR